MEIAILLFDDLTALDAVGPYELLKLMPEARVRFVAKRPGPQRMNGGNLVLLADDGLGDVIHPEIVVIPGGPGAKLALRDPEILGWVKTVHETSRWTTSVCTGSLILGAAGLLRGLKATSHWLAREALRQFGAEPVAARYVQEGKIITAAGVSAGIDMALMLVGLECGEKTAQAVQLGLEYDPQPPFDAGAPDKAPQAIVELLQSRAQGR
ncbi:MAG: DJ-1/PfpI family protein [Deltaproteobacteria bacterium]|nr:DJ-1/PfpI family protein [Deltaproteobacteria bacterium]